MHRIWEQYSLTVYLHRTEDNDQYVGYIFFRCSTCLVYRTHQSLESCLPGIWTSRKANRKIPINIRETTARCSPTRVCMCLCNIVSCPISLIYPFVPPGRLTGTAHQIAREVPRILSKWFVLISLLVEKLTRDNFCWLNGKMWTERTRWIMVDLIWKPTLSLGEKQTRFKLREPRLLICKAATNGFSQVPKTN